MVLTIVFETAVQGYSNFHIDCDFTNFACLSCRDIVLLVYDIREFHRIPYSI